MPAAHVYPTWGQVPPGNKHVSIYIYFTFLLFYIGKIGQILYNRIIADKNTYIFSAEVVAMWCGEKKCIDCRSGSTCVCWMVGSVPNWVCLTNHANKCPWNLLPLMLFLESRTWGTFEPAEKVGQRDYYKQMLPL